MNESLPWFPERASTAAVDFEWLFWYMMAVTGVAGLLVYAAMAVFCVQYRRGATSGSTPRILGSHRLELIWSIIPLFAFLSFFAWGAYVYNKAVNPPPDVATEIFVVGKQWMWKAQYPDGQRVIIGGNPANMTEAERASIGKLVLPVNRPVKITLTSEDVIHDFGIPAFRQKIDVLPMRYTTTWYEPTKTGEFHLFCDQYCGTWHSLMVGKVKVVTEEEYADWLEGVKPLQGSGNAVDGSPAREGEKLFLKLQCLSCHSANPQAKAPVLEGLYGTQVPLQGGQTVTADGAYIRESIRNPKAKVVQGWEAVMPHYDRKQVSEDDLSNLVAYIRSLKRGDTPKRTEQFPAPVGAPTTPSQSPPQPEGKK